MTHSSCYDRLEPAALLWGWIFGYCVTGDMSVNQCGSDVHFPSLDNPFLSKNSAAIAAFGSSGGK